MMSQIDIQSLVDIGFIVFVSVACFQSMFGSSGANERRTKQWQAELRELEAVLRDLIGEASAASRNLDRSLLKRKRELETLLSKLEGHEETRAPDTKKRVFESAPASQPKRVSQNAAPMTRVPDDFPNETWNQPLKLKHTVTPEEEPESLEEQLAKDEVYQQLNILDPIAYRVARRLLVSGREIHVVARKLELPVSEVRLLDKLLRAEFQKAMGETVVIEEPEVAENIKATAQVQNEPEAGDERAAKEPKSELSVDFEKLTPPKLSKSLQESQRLSSRIELEKDKEEKDGSAELDIDIEREVALL